ncbi:MAG: carbamoyltransferase HypF, partial [Deltaproteobacteria bacterium]|nr:carbamoyltransferase HypF [Deltaproteobacteria bacterium]
MQRIRISVKGVVQGVGFRPFVYRLALDCGLAGSVRNTSGTVDIEVEGAPERLAEFRRELLVQLPPLASITDQVVEPLAPSGQVGFHILESEARAGQFQLVSPDIATCDDCRRELFDSADRRFGYPFTNCTNCGPRFTIIEDIPYDRPLTTMRVFPMCGECLAEYGNPLDRRFHAQPNACPVCGPKLSLLSPSGEPIPADEPLLAVAAALLAGHIVAIKGLGGFHLVCDATR